MSNQFHFPNERIATPVILPVVHVASGSARNTNKSHKGEDDGNDDQLYILTTMIQQSDVKKYTPYVLLPAAGISSEVGNVHGKRSNGAECTVECTQPCPYKLGSTKASLLLEDGAAASCGKCPAEHGEEGRGNNEGLGQEQPPETLWRYEEEWELEKPEKKIAEQLPRRNFFTKTVGNVRNGWEKCFQHLVHAFGP